MSGRLILFLVSLAQGVAPGGPLRVAAASDLQSILPDLAARFERQTGERTTLTFGSSGNFFTQIQNGSPFDLYLSADRDYPQRLDEEGLIEPGSLQPYAMGTLVLWTRRDSGLDPSHGLETLTDARIHHVAIANPAHAPYGRAAVAALERGRLYDRVRPKLVLGENVSQAAQFVQSGNAEAGLIPLSLARARALGDAGAYIEVPSSAYPPIEQTAVILRSSSHKDAARRFLAFLRQPDVVRLLQDAGFAPPRPAPAAAR